MAAKLSACTSLEMSQDLTNFQSVTVVHDAESPFTQPKVLQDSFPGPAQCTLLSTASLNTVVMSAAPVPEIKNGDVEDDITRSDDPPTSSSAASFLESSCRQDRVSGSYLDTEQILEDNTCDTATHSRNTSVEDIEKEELQQSLEDM